MQLASSFPSERGLARSAKRPGTMLTAVSGVRGSFLSGAFVFLIPLVFLALGCGVAFGQNQPPAPAGAGGSFLGVGVAEIGASRANELKLPEGRGVEITRVEEESPADKAGLKTGDAVLQFNGQRVGGIEEFIRMVRETPPGRHVKLLISRDGVARTLTAVIGFRKQREVRIEVLPRFAPLVSPKAVPNFDMPGMEEGIGRSTLGIEIEPLTPQLAEYFGVNHGVLVRSVGKDTPASLAGFRAGDIITKVNGARIESPSDVFIAVHAPRSSRTLSVSVTREHHAIGLSPVVPGDGVEEDEPGADHP